MPNSNYQQALYCLNADKTSLVLAAEPSFVPEQWHFILVTVQQARNILLVSEDYH
jgi:hypothetical protein